MWVQEKDQEIGELGWGTRPGDCGSGTCPEGQVPHLEMPHVPIQMLWRTEESHCVGAILSALRCCPNPHSLLLLVILTIVLNFP